MFGKKGSTVQMDAYLKDVRHVECFYDTHVKTPLLPHFLTVRDGNFVPLGGASLS